jgi:large subunit ribosomal protein L1
MKKRSKKYREAKDKASSLGKVDVLQAVKVLKGFNNAKFDETVELSVKLGIDPRKSDQIVRGSFTLPHGIGKERRVVVFAEGDKADEAKSAGAVEVGSADLAARIQEGWLDFDVAIATPDMMRHVGKLGKILGPAGKMPSPKSGTVTDKVKEAVAEFMAGKVEYRNDKGGNLHIPVGKKSFEENALAENIEAILDHIKGSKPTGAKGSFMQRIHLCATMSPSVEIELK